MAIAAEIVLPQPVGEHHRVAVPRFILIGESPSQHRSHSISRDKTGGHDSGNQAFCLAVAGEIDGGLILGVEGLEGMVACLPVEVVRGSDGIGPRTLLGSFFPEDDEPVWFRVGQRTQQDRVDDAVNSSVGADTQSEGEDGRHRKPRVLPKRTDRVPQIRE
jgi:hypothetical protein